MYGKALKMKRIGRLSAAFLAVLTLLFSVCTLFVLPVSASEPQELDAYSSVLIYHNESGKILYSKGEEKSVPAGPAPRMTAALVFLEHYGKDLEKTVTVDARVAKLATSTMNPGLKGGEIITVYDLLCGMLIANSNDAVYALAFDLYDGASDAPERLLAAINEKAAALGMTDTLYVNITGQDPQNAEMLANESSLADLLTLSLAVQKQETVTRICAIDDLTLSATNKSGERRLLTRNYLLSAKRIGGYTYKYATGLAAADGTLSGYHALATAKIGSKTFTCISVGGREKYAAFTDAVKLFGWANGAYSYKKVLDRTTVFGEVSVRLSDDSDYVTVVPDRELSAFLPTDVDVKEQIRLEPHIELSDLTAPVHEGLIVGSVKVYYLDEEIGSARLVTTSSLSMSNSSYYLYMARRFFETPVFLTLAAGLLVFSFIFVFVGARVRYLRQTRRPDLYLFDEDREEEDVDLLPLEDGVLVQRAALLARRVGAELKQKLHGGKSIDKADRTPVTNESGVPAKPGPSFAEAMADRTALATEKPDEKAAVKEEAKVVRELILQRDADADGGLSKKQDGERRFYDVDAGRRFSGAKRLPGKDPEKAARDAEKRQGGYVPSGWGDRKDEENGKDEEE